MEAMPVRKRTNGKNHRNFHIGSWFRRREKLA
jgi:hypothetical protein